MDMDKELKFMLGGLVLLGLIIFAGAAATVRLNTIERECADKANQQYLEQLETAKKPDERNSDTWLLFLATSRLGDLKTCEAEHGR